MSKIVHSEDDGKFIKGEYDPDFAAMRFSFFPPSDNLVKFGVRMPSDGIEVPPDWCISAVQPGVIELKITNPQQIVRLDLQGLDDLTKSLRSVMKYSFSMRAEDIKPEPLELQEVVLDLKSVDEMKRLILEFLKDHPRSSKPRIQRGIESRGYRIYSGAALWRALEELREEGKIERTGAGKRGNWFMFSIQ